MARIFDWLDFVARENVGYIDRGANVKRGEINIKCPFCGSADPSYHMGLSLTSGYWACWRNSDHRGKSPLRLIVKILGVPFWKAKQLAGFDDTYVDPEGFSAAAARILKTMSGEVEVKELKELALPREFDLIENRGRSRYHFQYLDAVRGFDHYTPDVINDYLLCFDAHGNFRDRVILPYVQEGDLVAWTGRAISSHTEVRYRDLEPDLCLVPIKETLYNHDVVVSGGRVLVVHEGPFDALKLDFFGQDFGVRSVALSTNSMSDEQVYLLEDAASSFDRLVFMMDHKKSGFGVVDSMRIKQRVSTIKNASILPVPFGKKDAGELSPEEAARACDLIAKGAL